jgi:hypothetical protein
MLIFYSKSLKSSVRITFCGAQNNLLSGPGTPDFGNKFTDLNKSLIEQVWQRVYYSHLMNFDKLKLSVRHLNIIDKYQEIRPGPYGFEADSMEW